MKTKIFKIAGIMMLVAGGGLISCGSSEPIEIPCTEYSLPEAGCWWINIAPNEVIVINGNSEPGNYIGCPDDNYPEIDFSKNSLLLVLVKDVAGCNRDSGVGKLLLKQLSAHHYELSVDVLPSITGNAAPFFRYIAIITEKINEKSKIELNVIANLNEIS